MSSPSKVEMSPPRLEKRRENGLKLCVIPVSSKGRLTFGQKTGIQSIIYHTNNVVLAWIPASAGMT